MAFSFPAFPHFLRAQHRGLTPAAQAVPGAVHRETVCERGRRGEGGALTQLVKLGGLLSVVLTLQQNFPT